jgi:hypothetical protein
MSEACKENVLLKFSPCPQTTHPCLQHHILQVNIFWYNVWIIFCPCKVWGFHSSVLKFKVLCDIWPCWLTLKTKALWFFVGPITVVSWHDVMSQHTWICQFCPCWRLNLYMYLWLGARINFLKYASVDGSQDRNYEVWLFLDVSPDCIFDIVARLLAGQPQDCGLIFVCSKACHSIITGSLVWVFSAPPTSV